MKSVAELVGELQMQVSLLLVYAERGTPTDSGIRILTEIPYKVLKDVRAALDESYGREVVSK